MPSELHTFRQMCVCILSVGVGITDDKDVFIHEQVREATSCLGIHKDAKKKRWDMHEILLEALSHRTT